MLFNSINFFVFLPAVLLVLALAPRSWRNPVLLVSSYVFYGSWDWRFLALLFATTCIDYWVGHKIHSASARESQLRFLWVSLTANLVVLGFFKYFNFFIDSAAELLGAAGLSVSMPTLRIILPVGVSFYTFQSMSYVIDIYRRDAMPADNFRDYALYVAYFPQLVAGPISRVGDLLVQLQSPARLTAERANIGLMLILLGLVKKVLIADMVAPEVDRIFSSPSEMSSGMLLRGAYLFAFQIYGDFSGYSDMARGVSELFGVRLIINFQQPYLSQSITEFWRRWHISLSSWLRDYLYIPLGGNRHGRAMTYRNLMLTMLIGGLWHGANWTFVAWGGWHGFFLAVERMLGIGDEQAARERAFLPRVLATLVTFHVVVLGWVFFRAPNFAVAFDYFSGLLAFTDMAAVGLTPLVVAAAILLIDIPQNRWGDHAVFLRLPWWLQSPVYATACFTMLLYGGREIPFIYFQF
jgi:D-alanyl-lipoteichoic acid acyltransferase DltB (MBOAT superfamily)